jgi:hypothetical protein
VQQFFYADRETPTGQASRWMPLFLRNSVLDGRESPLI